MYRPILFVTTILLCSLTAHLRCQSSSPVTGKVANPAFDQTISSMISFSVPILSVKEAKAMEQVTYLDAREPAEFDTCHIPGAVFIGFDHWDSQAVQALPKDHTLVVYCSIGYRSEKIAGKLKKMGFQNVYNLYGSIFEWANEGNSLVSNNNTPTLKLHTYNKKWGKWVDNPSIQKVW